MSIVEYSVVIISRTPDEFLVRCGRCAGTGENNREYECHICKGTGKVRLSIPSGWSGNIGLLECGRCGGTGENNREYFCKVCKGVGALVKKFPRAVCSRCNGTGENSREYFCSSCDACGSVYLENIPRY